MTDFAEETCCTCGVVFGMPKALWKTCRNEKQTFYCPNGHGQSYKQSEADRLKAQLLKAEQAAEAARLTAERERRWRHEAYDQARHLERRVAAQRGVTTRMKNRVANGVCPCCNRTFANLARHMNTKHKGFVAEEVQMEVGQPIH
jgi:hypothetical protein